MAKSLSLTFLLKCMLLLVSINYIAGVYGKQQRCRQHNSSSTGADSQASQSAASSNTDSATSNTDSATSNTGSAASNTGSTTSSNNGSTSGGSTNTGSNTGSNNTTSVSGNTSTNSTTGSGSYNPNIPNNTFGKCFDLTATAFQPNWKGEATTTWCGIEFDKSSPILALPLAQLSQAYGVNYPVTYYSNQAVWNQMVSDWCGQEIELTGPAGTFKAYFGDANEWTSVDLNMNLFTTVKGVPTGSYNDPDAAGWMNNIKGCFTGNKVNLKNGYPSSY